MWWWPRPCIVLSVELQTRPRCGYGLKLNEPSWRNRATLQICPRRFWCLRWRIRHLPRALWYGPERYDKTVTSSNIAFPCRIFFSCPCMITVFVVRSWVQFQLVQGLRFSLLGAMHVPSSLSNPPYCKTVVCSVDCYARFVVWIMFVISIIIIQYWIIKMKKDLLMQLPTLKCFQMNWFISSLNKHTVEVLLTVDVLANKSLLRGVDSKLCISQHEVLGLPSLLSSNTEVLGLPYRCLSNIKVQLLYHHFFLK